MKLVSFSDGGARGNPGPAAIGVVIKDISGTVLKRIKQTIGETTNNQAEYKALLCAINESLALGAEELLCHLDSELVVKQMQGKYKIKEPGLQLLAAEALKLTSKFKKIEFKHVRREQNADADKLVNQALDNE